MQFGMFFPFQLPRPWQEDSELTLIQDSLEQAELGERCGIDYAWAQEHHFLEEYSHSTAPEVFLAAVSQRTTRMRVGHGVTLMPPAYNHPARVAERIATLDLVSRGRVEWGTGESTSRIELEGFQIPYLEKRGMWAEGVREAARMMSSEPYPGYEGRYFSMPERNVVPKPVQKPHPPLWTACTNRDTLKMAARLGIGALTFSFMDEGEARFWVNEYHQTFREECQPIGQTVNPRVAMLAGVMCHPDGSLALARGLRGQHYFKWALAHYYRSGVHVPGRTELWKTFESIEPEPMAGNGAIGTPETARRHFRKLEEAGVDQVMLLHQAGTYRHSHICESLELLGAEVFGEFRDRHERGSAAREASLAPHVERALSRVVKPERKDPEPVAAYPLSWQQRGATNAQMGARRSVDAAALWRLHVSGGSRSGRET